MIGVDWGITHLRAYRIGPDGSVIEARDEAKGIMAVAHAAFEGTLETVIGDWLEGEPEPFLMSGMIGSRQGWVEAQYVECPAHAVDIARALAPVTCAGRPGFICPGLTCRDIDGVPDVMRGEEVQIFGALALLPVGVSAICHPGTHSKHIVIEDATVVRFTTYMTGEMFAVLSDHSILGRTMERGTVDWQAFDEGVARAGQGGGLLHHLFGARTRVLMNEIPPTGEADYLSGMLIGHEIRAAGGAGPVVVIGAAGLEERYLRAFGLCGREVTGVPGETATVCGLRVIHDLAGRRVS